jgi:hypothetical protein
MEIRHFAIRIVEGRTDMAQTPPALSLEAALGRVIRSLNPYTGGEEDGMIFGPPVISIPSVAAGTDGEDASSIDVDVKNVPVEIDDYREGRAEWIFKAQPHRIQRALRIQYRHKAAGKAGEAGVFVTEFLLIGFAGSNGGG